jgi:CRP-like cAMP-binding protein
MQESYQKLTDFWRAQASLSEDQIASIASLFHPINLDKKQHFVHAGDIPQHLGFVVSGILCLYYVNQQGDEFTKSFCIENEFVGAFSALLLREPSSLFIQALEPTCLLLVNFAEYQERTSQDLVWQTLNRMLFEGLFIKKEKRERQLLLDDAVTRYRCFLEEYPGLESRVKQYHIASYLGITPVSLSRLRRQYKKLSYANDNHNT